MAMSAAQMVNDEVIKVGGAELGRAILMLVPSAVSGIGQCSFMYAFSDCKIFDEGSLGRVHVVDGEMEVERKMWSTRSFWVWLC